MVIFQIIAILALLGIISRTVQKWRKKEITGSLFGLWLIFWLFLIYLLADPNLLNRLADITGIGRGVDLAVYSSILILFYLLFKIYLRLEKNQKAITKIVEHQAIKDHKHHE